VVVGDQKALDGLAGVVVVPDDGGQGEDTLHLADEDTKRLAPAVAFQVGLAFGGVVDRFNDLAQRPEGPPGEPLALALSIRPPQAKARADEGRFEFVPIVLVANNGLPGLPGHRGLVDGRRTVSQERPHPPRWSQPRYRTTGLAIQITPVRLAI
jgi:hypothetical protein